MLKGNSKASHSFLVPFVRGSQIHSSTSSVPPASVLSWLWASSLGTECSRHFPAPSQVGLEFSKNLHGTWLLSWITVSAGWLLALPPWPQTSFLHHCKVPELGRFLPPLQVADFFFSSYWTWCLEEVDFCSTPRGSWPCPRNKEREDFPYPPYWQPTFAWDVRQDFFPPSCRQTTFLHKAGQDVRC